MSKNIFDADCIIITYILCEKSQIYVCFTYSWILNQLNKQDTEFNVF